MDEDVAYRIGRGVRAGARRARGQARQRAARGDRARHAAPAPAMAARYAEGLARRGRGRARHRDGRHRDALLDRGLARAGRRAHAARPRTTRRRTRARSSCGAAPSRSRATPASASCATWWPPVEPGPAGGRAGRAATPTTWATPSAQPRSSTSTPARIAPLKVVLDGGNGMAGPMVGPLLDSLPDRAGADLLDARRRVPRPRAEPPARGEPALHRRQGPRRGRRPRASRGTATPTAASSSTRRARSWTGTSSPRCWPSRCSRKEPGATVLYDVRASRAVRDVVERAGGTAL